MLVGRGRRKAEDESGERMEERRRAVGEREEEGRKSERKEEEAGEEARREGARTPARLSPLGLPEQEWLSSREQLWGDKADFGD